MYECPGCAGNLKFDIARQQLYCEYCGMQADPYSYSKEKDAEETEPPSGEYQVTVFICPSAEGRLSVRTPRLPRSAVSAEAP